MASTTTAALCTRPRPPPSLSLLVLVIVLGAALMTGPAAAQAPPQPPPPPTSSSSSPRTSLGISLPTTTPAASSVAPSTTSPNATTTTPTPPSLAPDRDARRLREFTQEYLILCAVGGGLLLVAIGAGVVVCLKRSASTKSTSGSRSDAYGSGAAACGLDDTTGGSDVTVPATVTAAGSGTGARGGDDGEPKLAWSTGGLVYKDVTPQEVGLAVAASSNNVDEASGDGTVDDDMQPLDPHAPPRGAGAAGDDGAN